MGFRQYIMDKALELLEAMEALWDVIGQNPDMYCVLIKKSDGRKTFYAERDLSTKSKIVRAFLSEDDANEFAKSKSTDSLTLYVYKMNYDSVYFSISRISSKINPIECRLTALDSDGRVYDIEKIWTEIIN